jgi:hypothetical protein
MQEALWVLGILLTICALAVAKLVPADQLVSVGQQVMLGAAAFGVPLEVVYFALLAWALHKNGNAPRGWYWRSFEHHHLLQTWQRRVILPPFILGALAFLGIVLGIVISLLGFAAVFGLLGPH